MKSPDLTGRDNPLRMGTLSQLLASKSEKVKTPRLCPDRWSPGRRLGFFEMQSGFIWAASYSKLLTQFICFSWPLLLRLGITEGGGSSSSSSLHPRGLRAIHALSFICWP